MRNNQRRIGTSTRNNPAPAIASTGMVYQVPTEFVELPSRGQFYTEEHPLYAQETVEIKFMTAKEEDILASTALIKKGLVIDRLLENILVADIDPRSLLIGDRSAIMIAARISGYGNIYETEIRCPVCSAQSPLLFDLAKMIITDRCFDDDFMSNNSIEIDRENNLFSVTLPTTGAKLGLRLMNNHDEREFSSEAVKNENSRVTTMLSVFVESVNGSLDRAEVKAFIQNMPAKDSKYTRNLYSRLVPNIELRDDFSCSRCFHQKEMEVPLDAGFFWPE